ncbi:hypothetical protein EXIGLDRAFT_357244 [Exidia glandulosa HHB12029]|uniref:U3 small nucleolar RNA-associated protein 10 n=1 Tax=Exidia glandulosa HHB12029 TaxID=1314781 RepID=A0A165C8S1_EXIGL|nr:hypothetical protein EXIGLDRAFT_357244 [Exidia glandulosa HHB12029]
MRRDGCGRKSRGARRPSASLPLLSKMATALQRQLAKAASSSAHASLLADRGKRGKRRAQSYLFTARDADTHDLTVVHALGANGLARLVLLNSKFSEWEEPLFSLAARDTDRTLLDQDAVRELDDALNGFLVALTPYLLDSAAGKALEWLVRRFRIQEFNVDAVLRLFTPYHESAHFAKMLNILHIESSPAWSFLVPFKTAAKPLPRSALVAEMRKTSQVARFVASVLPEALKAQAVSDAIVSFNASVFLDFFSAADGGLNEETLAFLLPALVAPLSGGVKASNNCLVGSLLLLAALAQKCRLAQDATRSIIKSIVKAKKAVSPAQLQATLVAVTGPQDQLTDLPKGVVEALVANSDAFADTLQLDGSEKLFVPFCSMVLPTCEDNEAHAEALSAVIQATTAPASVVKELGMLLFANAKFGTTVGSLLGAIKQRRPDVFAACVEESKAALGEAAVDEIVLALSMPGAKGKGRMFVASSDADAAVRAAGVREMVQALSAGTADDEVRLILLLFMR